MEPGTYRAWGAMYEQLRRAFKVASILKSWWRATNAIRQGFPLLVIRVNVLSTIWKWEVDSLRLQVCVATAVLPPAPEDIGPGHERDLRVPPLSADHGAGYAALWSWGCDGLGGGCAPRYGAGHKELAPGHKAGRPRVRALLLGTGRDKGPSDPAPWAGLGCGGLLPPVPGGRGRGRFAAHCACP